tara:strand:+ start:72 stop:254 length:183 start_codon:yes stop_codon:yes gene_type:complete
MAYQKLIVEARNNVIGIIGLDIARMAPRTKEKIRGGVGENRHKVENPTHSQSNGNCIKMI